MDSKLKITVHRGITTLFYRIRRVCWERTSEIQMMPEKDGRQRHNIAPGALVGVVQKKDQGSGKITGGEVGEILTGSSFHPHGIKVRLTSGIVGRVQKIGEGGNP
jgi:uncharacterized repeat protein (TIGR03833 family)